MFFLLSLNPLLILSAVLPALALLVYVYRKDRLEAEPIGLLLTLVAIGVVSTALASFAERVGIYIMDLFLEEDTLLYNGILYFGVVAFAEEGFKYLVLKRKTWRAAAFNCRFDGIVYAAFVSLGFALWENILYVTEYGFATALARAVTSVPGHCCFGVFMGFWYGLAGQAEREGDAARSSRYRILAVVVPALLHGAYDFLATLEDARYAWLFLPFILAMFVIAFLVVRKTSAEDHYL